MSARALLNAISSWFEANTFQILALLSGFVAATLIARAMRRLDEGKLSGLGVRLSAVAVLIVATIASVQGLSPSPNAPYVAAFVVLLGAVVLWFVIPFPAIDAWFRSWWPRHESSGSRPTSRPWSSSPALLLLIASGCVLGILWIIAVGVSANSVAGGSSSNFLVRAAGAGVLAMATLQGIRTLVPVRGAFHQATVQRWIDDSLTNVIDSTANDTKVATAAGATDKAGAPESAASSSKPTTQSAPSSIERPDTSAVLARIAELASPASGTRHYALFDLPIEQLCGQIAGGADRLLDNPEPFRRPIAAEAVTQPSTTTVKTDQVPSQPDTQAPPKKPDDVKRATEVHVEHVLAALAASSADIHGFLELSMPAVQAIQPAQALGHDGTGQNQDRTSTVESSSKDDAIAKRKRELMRLRASISHRIQQNIDRLQIDTTFWWKRMLRGLAVAICGVLGLTVFSESNSAAVVFAIVGGFLATVARDVVAIVEKTRR